MDYITIVVIAVGLAMDAFVVSIVSGSVYKQLRIRHALRIALFFGGFQAVMPLIGALAGLTLREYIESCHCWIAFGLLTAVGTKMIYESFKIKSVEENFDPSNIFVLLVLSVATSIDALAVGITLSLIAGSIITAAVIIGLITFVLSYLGVFIGKKFGHFFEKGELQALRG
ncbi:MAG: manganese efflux pump MntP [Planctomycetota bacterium]|jgi:putative Mn2+ efflux pump MntP